MYKSYHQKSGQDICYCALEMLKSVCCHLVRPPSHSLSPLYLAVSIFCHCLALLFAISDCLLHLQHTSLYHSNSCMVRWKLSARTGFQDKVEVSEWPKIKSNFNKKTTTKQLTPPPQTAAILAVPAHIHLHICTQSAQNLTHNRRAKREGPCTSPPPLPHNRDWTHYIELFFN